MTSLRLLPLLTGAALLLAMASPSIAGYKWNGPDPDGLVAGFRYNGPETDGLVARLATNGPDAEGLTTS